MSLLARVKIIVAQTITAPWVGSLLRTAFGDRVKFRGVPIASCSPFVSPTVTAKLFWGIYEGSERRFVEQYLSPDVPVIEFGSSLGGVSSHIARKLAPGQHLICVEANPHLIPVLDKNLSTNAAHLNARSVHAAISSADGTVSFAISASSLSSKVGHRDDALETISAPARQLSDLCAEAELEEYQLVMDIEGAEASIVIDDSEALSGCVRILAELHQTEHAGKPYSVLDLIEKFKALGFDVRDQHGPVVVFERDGAPA